MSETVYTIESVLENYPEIKHDFEDPNKTSQRLYDKYNRELELVNNYLVKPPEKLNEAIEQQEATVNEYEAIKKLHGNTKEYRNFKNETGLDRKGLEDKINKLNGSIQRMKDTLKQYERLNKDEVEGRQRAYSTVLNHLKGITDYIDSKEGVYDSYTEAFNNAKRMIEIIERFNVSPEFTIGEELKEESPERTLKANETLYTDTIPKETERIEGFIKKEPNFVEQIKQEGKREINLVPPTRSPHASKAKLPVLVPMPQSAKTLEELDKAYETVSKYDHEQFKELLKTFPHDEPNNDNKRVVINRTDWIFRDPHVFSTLTNESSIIKPLLTSAQSAIYDAIQNQYASNIERSLEPNDRAYIEQRYRWLDSPNMQEYRNFIMQDLSGEGAAEINRIIYAITHRRNETLPPSTIELIEKVSRADDNIKNVFDEVLSSSGASSWDKVKNFDTLLERLAPFKQKTLARNYIREGMDSQEAITKAKSNMESLGKKQDAKIDTTIKETVIKEPSNRQSRIRYMRRQAADIEGSKSQQYTNSSYKKIDEEARKLVQNMRRTTLWQSKREELKEPLPAFTKLMMLQAHQRQTHKDMDYQPVQLTSEEYIRS